MSTDRPATTDPADERMRDLADQRAEDFVNNLTGRAEQEHIRKVIAEAVRKAVPMHSGGWVTANNVLDALDREGYTVAARASESNCKCPLGLRHVNCSCAEPEQPWDEAGCSRSCRNGHTRRWGACAYGKEPAPTLHRFETGVAADGYVSGGYEPMSVEQVAAWLHEQGYTVTKGDPR